MKGRSSRPIKVTFCPPAFAAPCSATLTPEHARAIRAHNEALEERYQASAGDRRVPITFGKKKRGPIFPRHKRIEHDAPMDLTDDLPEGFMVNG